jgi:hypothetical protein
MPPTARIDARWPRLPLGDLAGRIKIEGGGGGMHGMGQDYGVDPLTGNVIDTSSASSFDFTQNLDTPTFPTPTVYNVAPPDIGSPAPAIAPEYGPAAPGEIPNVSSFVGPQGPTDLNQLILTGAIPVPQGSNLSQSDIASLRASGATADDIGAILQGTNSVAGVLQQIAQVTQLASQTSKALLNLPSTPTGRAPTPTTAPIGYSYNAYGQLVPITSGLPATSFTSALSSAASWFGKSTIFSGIPNGVLAGIAVLALAGITAAGARR